MGGRIHWYFYRWSGDATTVTTCAHCGYHSNKLVAQRPPEAWVCLFIRSSLHPIISDTLVTVFGVGARDTCVSKNWLTWGKSSCMTWTIGALAALKCPSRLLTTFRSHCRCWIAQVYLFKIWEVLGCRVCVVALLKVHAKQSSGAFFQLHFFTHLVFVKISVITLNWTMQSINVFTVQCLLRDTICTIADKKYSLEGSISRKDWLRTCLRYKEQNHDSPPSGSD